MNKEQLGEQLQLMLKQQQERQATELVDAQVKMLTAVFDKATAYTNLMIVGAYAGFFGLWQLTKDYLTKPEALWSALLVFVSLFFFVVFEVTKMVVVQIQITSKAKALQSPEVRTSPQALALRLGEIASSHERVNFAFMWYWVATMVVTVGSGLAGAGVLAWAFIVGLAK